MKKHLYFLSCLPRSGSTVISAILNQHPDLCVSTSSSLVDILLGALRAWDSSLSTRSALDKQQSQEDIINILQGICQAKYQNTEKPCVLDKSRAWVAPENIHIMSKVFGDDIKIIATVRKVEDCAASFVRVVNPENVNEFCKNHEFISHLKESYQFLHRGYSSHRKNILCVDYDDFLENPMQELKRIESFLGLKEFTGYTFDKIDGTPFRELDEDVWRARGLHEIKPQLKRYSSEEETRQLLGVNYEDFLQPSFWKGETFRPKPLSKLDTQLAAGIVGDLAGGYKIALELERDQPWDDRAAFNRGWYKMWKGQLLDGMRDIYRGRLEKVFGNEMPNVPTPMWDGKSKGVILLNLEGGLGDQIHGAGFVRYIVERGCTVIVACSGQLASLFKDIPGVSAVVQHEAMFGVVHDFWVPSMSAPMILGIEYEDVIGTPYIAKPETPPHSKKRIGLRWQGNPQFEHEQHRQFPCGLFFDAVQGHDVEYISLQRDYGAELKPYWVKEPPLNHWEETRQAIASCDLVITSCTSVAHLAAAMGVPTWIIIPILPYYLWAKPGETTEWYDNVTLIRQVVYGDWTEPLKQVSKRLKEFVGG